MNRGSLLEFIKFLLELVASMRPRFMNRGSQAVLELQSRDVQLQ